MAADLCVADSNHGSDMYSLYDLFAKAAGQAVLCDGRIAGCWYIVDCHRGFSSAPQFLGIYLANE